MYYTEVVTDSILLLLRSFLSNVRSYVLDFRLYVYKALIIVQRRQQFLAVAFEPESDILSHENRLMG